MNFSRKTHESVRAAPDELAATALVGWTGSIITAIGVAIAISARFVLGHNWSGWAAGGLRGCCAAHPRTNSRPPYASYRKRYYRELSDLID